MPLILGANSLAGGYEIDNSLRFNSGSTDNLTRTPASAGNRNTWTWSGWVKRSNLSVVKIIFSAGTSGNNDTTLYFNASDQLEFFNRISSSVTGYLITTQLFRDVSAWYHIVAVWNSNNATAGDRMRLYVNGSEITSFATDTNPSLNENSNWNNTVAHGIGNESGGSSSINYDGYIADTYFIDGQQLTPSSFGETDEDSGIWKPKAYTGTFGTNGFYLDFEDSANLGNDMSGNNNDFTVNNLTSIDQTTDTPTNNFATWNPLNAYNATTVGTLSEGNLKVSGTASDGGISSTIGVSAGKWYWEVKYTTQSGGDPVVGIINSVGANKIKYANSGSLTSGSGVWCLFNLTSGGYGFQENGVFVSYPSSTLANGDILNIAIDVDAQKLWYGKNGTWYNSGNPATGSNAVSTNLTANETWFAYCEKRNGTSVWETNFGNPPYSANSYADANGFGNFSYSVPSGYYALCTKNLYQYGF